MNAQRVLYIVNALGRAGLEMYLLRFLRHLNSQDLGWEHHVLCTSGKGGELEASYRHEGAEILLHRQGYFNIFEYLGMFHILKAGRYSAVCDFSGDFSGITLFLARKAGVEKRIASYRGWLPLYRQDPLRKAYVRFIRCLVRSHATDILSNSKACFELFFPNYWKNDARFKVVYNGVPIGLYSQPFDAGELRNKLGIASDKVIVGHFGRYDKAKNHNTILDVAKRFQDTGRDDIVFLFIGHGIPEGIGPISEQLGLHNVVCSPARADIPDILRILDAFIFPSITEGQPNALLEVMFEGIPFVASNIPSIKECVHYDAYDWLVNPFDVEGAFKKVVLMIDNLERSKLKAAKMQPWIQKRHDATRCFGQLAECLRSAGP